MAKGGYRPGSGRKKGSIPWNKGVPMRETTKLKLSKSKKGTPSWNRGIKSGNHGNGFKKGQAGTWRGKRFSPEYRQKLAHAKGNTSYGNVGCAVKESLKLNLQKTTSYQCQGEVRTI